MFLRWASSFFLSDFVAFFVGTLYFQIFGLKKFSIRSCGIANSALTSTRVYENITFIQEATTQIQRAVQNGLGGVILCDSPTPAWNIWRYLPTTTRGVTKNSKNFQPLLRRIRHNNLSKTLEYWHLTPGILIRKYYVAYLKYHIPF